MNTIYVSDLDGTLVNADAELSEYALEKLNFLISEGLPLTVASARSIVSIQQMLGGIEIQLPVICFNGAFLSCFKTGDHHIVNAMKPDVARDVFECFADFDCIPFISTYTGSRENVYYNSATNAGMQWYVDDRFIRKDPRSQRTDDLTCAFNDEVVCMTVINRKEILDDLEVELIGRFSGQIEIHHFENQYSPGWYWLTVHDVRATKGQAISSLKEMCGLQESRVVVFGDNINDVKMFLAADHAIAVENATDEIKSHANEVIGSHLEDGVVNYLLENWRR